MAAQGNYFELARTPSRRPPSRRVGSLKDIEPVLPLVFSYLSLPQLLKSRYFPFSDRHLYPVEGTHGNILKDPFGNMIRREELDNLVPSTVIALFALRTSNSSIKKFVDVYLKNQTKLNRPIPEFVGRESLLNLLSKALEEKYQERRGRLKHLRKEKKRRRENLILGVALIPLFIMIGLGAYLSATSRKSSQKSDAGFSLTTIGSTLAMLSITAAQCGLFSAVCPPTFCPWTLPPQDNHEFTLAEIDPSNRETLIRTTHLFRDFLGDRRSLRGADFQAGMDRLLLATKDDIRELRLGRSITTSATVFAGAGSTLETPLMQDFDV